MASVICQRWLDTASNTIGFSLHHDSTRLQQFVAAMAPNRSMLIVGPGRSVEVPGGWGFDKIYADSGTAHWSNAMPSWPVFTITPAIQPTPARAVSDVLSVQPKHEEKKPMSEEKRSTKDVVKDSFKEAAELAAARATNKLLATLVLDKTGLSLKFPMLATEKGRAAFETALPIMIHTLATNVNLPKASIVAAASESAMKMAMVDGMGVVMDELVKMVMPFWEDVVALFEKKGVPGLPEGEKPIAAGEAATVGTQEPVVA